MSKGEYGLPLVISSLMLCGFETFHSAELAHNFRCSKVLVGRLTLCGNTASQNGVLCSSIAMSLVMLFSGLFNAFFPPLFQYNMEILAIHHFLAAEVVVHRDVSSV